MSVPPPPAAPLNSAHLQAVLFDMDGLLVQTERIWFEAETEVVAALSRPDRPVRWTPEHQRALVGGSLSATAVYLIEVTESTRPAEAVQQLLLDAMQRRLRAGPVRWMPGARELLAQVNGAGVPCALVSASYRCLVDAVLAAIAGHTAGFDVTVAGDEVPRTKPHPDPYLLAAARLGVAPERCLVLEDSPTGVAAALAAGCVTVAVPSLVPIPPTPGLHQIASLAQVDLGALQLIASGAARDGSISGPRGSSPHNRCGIERSPDRRDVCFPAPPR